MAAYVISGIGDPWHCKRYVVEIKIMIIIKLVLERSRKWKEEDD